MQFKLCRVGNAKYTNTKVRDWAARRPNMWTNPPTGEVPRQSRSSVDGVRAGMCISQLSAGKMWFEIIKPPAEVVEGLICLVEQKGKTQSHRI